MNTYRAKFYDRMAAEADWDRWTNPWETARRLRLVFGELLREHDLAGKSFLDCGSGGGHFSAAAVARGARLTSVDVGPHLLAQVARRCASEPTLVVGSVIDLPFAGGSFEVVLATEVIEHTAEPEKGLLELARVVRPGGTIVVTSPGRLWQPVVRAASGLRLRVYQGQENFLWAREARAILEAAGVAIDEFRGFNLLPLFHDRWTALQRLGDRAGRRVPGLFVNWAIRGRKR